MNYQNIDLESQEDERITLAVLLQDPHFIAQLNDFDLKPALYSIDVHQALFTAIISVYNEKGNSDVYLVSSRLKSLGIEKINGISIHSYITESLCRIPINKESYTQYFENLLKWYEARESDKKLAEERKWIRLNRHKTRAEIKDHLEATMTEISTISVQNMEDELVDFYGVLQQTVEDVANSEEPLGLFSPFPIFNAWYGMFRFGNVYAFCAKAKVGKSTFLNMLSNFFVRDGKGKTHVLFCDTEMSASENIMRYMAAQTGIDSVEFEEGTYTQNKEYVKNVQRVFENAKNYTGLFHHIDSGNRTIQDVEALCRRYHRRFVKDDENLVIVYDYIKLTGESERDKKEWEIIGEKANRLKQMAKSLKRTFVITSVQLNEQGNVSQSARIKWFLTGIFKLYRKSYQEICEYGDQFGSHRLEKIETRFLGREGRKKAEKPIRIVGKDDRGKEKTEFVQNAINLRIDAFHVSEKGTYEDEVEEMLADGKQLTIAQPKSKYGEMLERF